MTKTFSLVGFAGMLSTLRLEMDHANHEALDKAARLVQEEAKRVLGTYEYNWPTLAPSTLARKAADTPGYETGELQGSVERQSDHKEACVGTDELKGLWFELGTPTQPPRSFLAEALRRKTPELLDVVGRHIHGHLVKG